MNRQYIGARYVPKFFTNSEGNNNWVSGVEYEALTIVSYLGNSYASKIPVPATTTPPNADTTHWVVTGNYNEQIATYREETEAVKNGLDKLTRKKYYFFGDSYLAGYSPDGNTTNWGVLTAEKLGLTDFTIGAYSGCAISTAAGRGYYLPDIIRNLAITDGDTYTDIVLCLGRNDASTSNTVSGLANGFTDLKAVLASVFPNATYRIGFIGSDFNITGYDGSASISSRLYSCLTTYITQPNYLNGVENILSNRELMASDGKHPNQLGQNALATGIANAIKYGSCETFYQAKGTAATLIDGLKGSITFGETCRNGFTTIFPPVADSNLTFDTPVSITGSAYNKFKLATNVPFKYYVPVGQGQTVFDVIVQCHFTDNTYIMESGYLSVEVTGNNKTELYLTIPKISAAGTGYFTKEGCDNIRLFHGMSTTKYWIG